MDPPNDGSITGYVVLRRKLGVDRKREFRELVANTGKPATTYTDKTVESGIRYTYRIMAINKYGVSERSRWFNISTPAAKTVAPNKTVALRGHVFTLPSVPEGSTDLPNNNTSPGVVAVDDSVVGELDTNSDRDRYKVELRKGVRYQIDMEGRPAARGTLGDPKMSLIMPDGTKITDDASGFGGSARFTKTWEFDESGWIEAYRGPGTSHRTGTYTISVIVLGSGKSEGRGDENIFEVKEDKNTRGRLDMNASVTGVVDRNNKDWFRVNLVNGRVYHFDLTAHSNLLDPKLWGVFDNEGVEIEGNRADGSVSAPAQVTFTANYTGRHFVSVGRKDSDPGSGPVFDLRSYTLSVSGDVPDDDSTSAVVTTNGMGVRGEIDFSGDVDWYAVELQVPQSYRVDVDSGDATHGYLRNPVIAGIYDADSTLVPDTRDDNDDGGDARVDFRAYASGTYYVAVTGTIADTPGGGFYSLSVRSQPLDLFPADNTTSGVVEVDGDWSRGFISKPVQKCCLSGYFDFDTDWFAVDLVKDSTYRIDMKGATLIAPSTFADPAITLFLPQINAIYGSDGRQLVDTFHRDESSAHYLFRVTFHAHRSGTYYIAASGESFEWGGYELRVTDITQDD